LLQTEYLDEGRKSVEGYKGVADPKAGELSHYLLLLYHKIAEQSLLKHSRRPSSSLVSSYVANPLPSFSWGKGLVALASTSCACTKIVACQLHYHSGAMKILIALIALNL
jgi:hypothetical protein